MRIAMVFLLILAAPGLSMAQGYGSDGNKKGTWEWAIAAVLQDAENTGSTGGSRVDIDEGIGLGFGLGYYLTDRLVVGGDIEWLAPDYSAVLVDDNGAISTFDHELTQFNFRFKGTYNFLAGPFTPYAELGAGWTYVDSNP
ncbi:MAG: outer membrane beta-barrel protein [Woeseia sp.]